MKELEGQAGATPALPGVLVPPGPKHPSVDGVPGPSPAMGPSDALVRVLIFSDFQCPVCRRVVEPVKELARRYPEDVQFIFKENALEMHRNAARAAAAAIAAQRQGKFWEMHDLLFQDQSRLSDEDLRDRARQLGLDLARFDRDRASDEVAQQIVYERNLAAALGARGTPGFFVNGRRLVGWGSYGGFKAMVERALREAKPYVAKVGRAKAALAATRASGSDGAKVAELVWGYTGP